MITQDGEPQFLQSVWILNSGLSYQAAVWLQKSLNVRDSFMKKIFSLTHFKTLSKEDKLRMILNLSCENHVINDIMKYIKQFVRTIHCLI